MAMMMQRLLRILSAAIVLIALSFAPSLAKAHNGHSHHASVHQAHGHGHTVSAQADHSGAPLMFQQSAQKEAGALPASERNCVGDCCSFACAACCAAALLSPFEPENFSPTITRLTFALSQAVASRAPESIRRPPKHSI